MSTNIPANLARFPESLAVLIKLRGIKKQELARTVGVSPSSLSEWLAGTAKPSADMLVNLADVFGVSLDRLIGRATPGAEALYALRAAGLALDNIIAPPERQSPKKDRK